MWCINVSMAPTILDKIGFTFTTNSAYSIDILQDCKARVKIYKHHIETTKVSSQSHFTAFHK